MLKIENLEVTKNATQRNDGPLGLSKIMELYKLPFHHLKEKPFQPKSMKMMKKKRRQNPFDWVLAMFEMDATEDWSPRCGQWNRGTWTAESFKRRSCLMACVLGTLQVAKLLPQQGKAHIPEESRFSAASQINGSWKRINNSDQMSSVSNCRQERKDGMWSGLASHQTACQRLASLRRPSHSARAALKSCWQVI